MADRTFQRNKYHERCLNRFTICYDRIKCKSAIHCWKQKMFVHAKTVTEEVLTKKTHKMANSDLTRGRILDSRTTTIKDTDTRNMLEKTFIGW